MRPTQKNLNIKQLTINLSNLTNGYLKLYVIDVRVNNCLRV